MTEQRVAGKAFSFTLSGEYEPCKNCVQYGETNLHFITRLYEEESIYFYFEHTDSSHTVCFKVREGRFPIQGNSSLWYFQGSGQVAGTAVISPLAVRQQVNSNAASCRDGSFKKPRLNLEVKKDEMSKKLSTAYREQCIANNAWSIVRTEHKGNSHRCLSMKRLTEECSKLLRLLQFPTQLGLYLSMSIKSVE